LTQEHLRIRSEDPGALPKNAPPAGFAAQKARFLKRWKEADDARAQGALQERPAPRVTDKIVPNIETEPHQAMLFWKHSKEGGKGFMAFPLPTRSDDDKKVVWKLTRSGSGWSVQMAPPTEGGTTFAVFDWDFNADPYEQLAEAFKILYGKEADLSYRLKQLANGEFHAFRARSRRNTPLRKKR